MATKSDGPRRATFAAVLACTLAATAPAYAEDAVEAARKSFVEAYADERAGRFADALTKLADVRKVRDTASVRYRIGACEEGLGRLVEARESYAAVEAVARPDDGEVVASAKNKVRELDTKLGAISLRVDGATTDRARIDDREIVLREGRASVRLAPGEHRVAYAPAGESEAVTPITVEAGKTTMLVLDRRGAREAPPAPVVRVASPPAATAPRPEGGGTSTLGVVATVAGGALVVATIVSLVVRESAIGSIDEACPSGVCPRSRENDVESARSRAETLLPVAAITGAASVIALGTGLYLLAKPTGSNVSAPSGLTLHLGGRF